MAGYMYLGNKKVCPAIVVGQSEPPEYDSLIRMPKGLKELDVGSTYVCIQVLFMAKMFLQKQI